ncbi:hypothetical protein B9Z55_012506 [Caenorhabditis nigoni]|uniref:Uncharacterized protein n=1 Tax=Caenorhabditis nigoni TaxID=1611254 RepID=A0A2G5TXG1_9PELO|nr:hypothetical protein B9Z55_012506 [Caenorhabditis nigoni]
MVHEHFLDRASREFCAEYEFLKRNPAREAHRNVCEMLMSTRVPVSKKCKTSNVVLRKRREDFRESTDTDSDTEEPDTWYNEHEEKLNVDYPIGQLEAVFEKCYRDEFLRRNNESVDNEKLIKEAGIMERYVTYAVIADACHRLPTLVDACRRLPTLINSCRRLPSLTNTCRRLPTLADACRRLSTLADACRRLPTLVDACRRLPTLINSCRRLPTLADACRRLPTFADACRRLPTLADARRCSPMLADTCRRLPTLADA